MEGRDGTEGEVVYFGGKDAGQRPGVTVSIQHEGDGLCVVDQRDLMEGGCLDGERAFGRAKLCGGEAEITGCVDIESVGAVLSRAVSEQDLLASEGVNSETKFVTESGVQILQIPFDETDGTTAKAQEIAAARALLPFHAVHSDKRVMVGGIVAFVAEGLGHIPSTDTGRCGEDRDRFSAESFALRQGVRGRRDGGGCGHLIGIPGFDDQPVCVADRQRAGFARMQAEQAVVHVEVRILTWTGKGHTDGGKVTFISDGNTPVGIGVGKRCFGQGEQAPGFIAIVEPIEGTERRFSLADHLTGDEQGSMCRLLRGQGEEAEGLHRIGVTIAGCLAAFDDAELFVVSDHANCPVFTIQCIDNHKTLVTGRRKMKFDKLTAFLNDLPAKGIPGSSTMISVAGETVYAHSAGFSSVDRQQPSSETDIYWLYSLSKPITVCAVMQCVERGLLALDEEIDRYMPELSEWTVRKETGIEKVKAPTIRQLLTMCAGLNYDLSSPSVIAAKTANPDAGTYEIVKAIAREPLQFVPGTHFQYSLAHDVLGSVIEAVSGQRFGEYLKQNVFIPLGMYSTGFSMDDEQREHFADLYVQDLQTGENVLLGDDNIYQITPAYESGGAGLFSTAQDYLLFAEMMSNGGVGRNGARILRAETIDMIRADQMTEQTRKDFDQLGRRGYSYGLGVRTKVDSLGGEVSSAFGEFGWDGAAGSYVIMDPQIHLAVVYLQHVHCCASVGTIQVAIRETVYDCIQ